MTIDVAPRTQFADLRFIVTPDVIYLPARLHEFPLLESPDSRRERVRLARARQQRLELSRFLSALDAELAPRVGVRYEVSLTPHDGRYSIRIPAGRSILIIKVDHTGLTFSPSPAYDRDRRMRISPPWRKHFATQPAQKEFFTLLEQRIARHNAKGGQYNN